MRRLHRASTFTALGAALLSIGSLSARPSLAVEPSVVVQPGDTLTSIAAAHGTTTAQLASINQLDDPNLIFAGQRLRIGSPVAPAPTAGDPGAPTHAVIAGETLTAIAARYGTTVSILASLNRLADPSYIMAGQILDLPVDRVSAQSGGGNPGWIAEVVHPGDTLMAIAARHGTTVAALADANGIGDPSLIFAGATILVPGAADERAAATEAPAASAPPPAVGAIETLAAPEPTAEDAAHSEPPAAAAPGGEPPAGEPMPDWMATLTSARVDVRDLVEAQAVELGVPVPLALAVAWQESGWQQSVVSSSGAIGVMQLLPDTAAWVGEAMLGEAVDVYEVRSNIRAGVRLLRHYLDRYHDQRLALAAYFQGQRAVDERGIYAESIPYIDSILYHERFFGG
jgi:LysM repeat protein